MSARKGKLLNQIGFYIFAVVFMITIAFPFLWQILNSLKALDELYCIPPLWIPTKLTIQSYVEAFTREPFLLYIKNSAIIAIGTTIISLICGSLAAYSLARLKIKGKKLILMLILAVTLFPPIIILNPLFLIMRELHLLNTYWGLMLVNTTFGLPMAIWFLTGFFETIPSELEEAALIDGATLLQAFRKIILPLVAPGTFTVGILVFITAWNQYLFALVFNTRVERRTVTVGITMYQTQYHIPWGTIAAASVVITIPLIIMVLLLQKRIVSGLLTGGVKG